MSTEITLKQAIKKFKLFGLDADMLKRQDIAFGWCMEFLRGIEPSKRINHRHSSYGYKHMVENPSYHGRGRNDQDILADYKGYVYEGTFVLAAMASGFRSSKPGAGLWVALNIPEKGLRRRLKELASADAESRNKKEKP